MSGTLSITRPPLHPDFIGNNPAVEFSLTGYSTRLVSERSFYLLLKSFILTNSNDLIISFSGHVVTFRITNIADNDPNTLQAQTTRDAWIAEFDRKIKRHHILSKYFRIINTHTGSSVGFSIRFFPKETTFGIYKMLESLTLNWNLNMSLNNTTNFTTITLPPANWKLWTKLKITKNGKTQETPDLFFDADAEQNIRVPLEIARNYFTAVDVPNIFETLYAYPLKENTLNVSLLYAEAYGEEDIEVQWVQESENYLICNGEIDFPLYEKNFFDWFGLLGANGLIFSMLDNYDIMQWGKTHGETVRSFKEMPQYVYFSTLKATANQRLNLYLEYMLADGTVQHQYEILQLPAGTICRIPVSAFALGINRYNILNYTIDFQWSIKGHQARFVRTFDIVTQPYNARIFLLQNKYGLLEAFYIDNLLEEKTVEGNTVICADYYRIDISKVESVFTARTGSKRISEMQLFKQSAENPHNYILQEDEFLPIVLLPDSFKIADEEKDLQNIEFQFMLKKGAKAFPATYAGNSVFVLGYYPRGNDTTTTTDIHVTFDRPPVSADLEKITLTTTNGQSLSVVATIADNKLNISSSELQNNTTYTVSIPFGTLENVNEDIQWSFSTISGVAVTETTPLNRSQRVPINTFIAVTFNQDIEADNLSLIQVAGISGTLTPSIVGNRLIISQENLENATDYQVHIPAGSIRNYNQNIDFEFSTIEAIAITALTPNFFSSNNPLDAPIAVTFNQDISAGTLSIIEVAGISGTITPSIIGNQLIIAHEGLEYNKTYRVTVPTGSIENYNQPVTWIFNTLEYSEIPFDLQSISPTGERVLVNEVIRLTFTHPITAGDLSGIRVFNTDFEDFEISPTVIDNQLIINHNFFDFETEYTVLVPANTVNGYSQNVRWSFRTVEKLAILSLYPVPDAVNLPADAFRVVFNQPIIPLNLSLIQVIGISESITSIISDNQLIIEHEELLDYRRYTIIIPTGSIVGITTEIRWSFGIDRDHLFITPESLWFPYQGSIELTTIITNKNWRVEMARAPWLSIDPMNGSGNGSTSHSASENTGRNARQTTAIFSASNVQSIQQVNNQAGKPEFVTINNISASEEGGDISITGTSNSSKLYFTITGTDNNIGISLPSTYIAAGNSTANNSNILNDPGATLAFDFSITISIPVNNTNQSRTSLVRVIATGGQSATSTITQLQNKPS